MKRDDPSIVLLAEFRSKTGDAGRAVGVVLHQHPGITWVPGDFGKFMMNRPEYMEYVVHTFYHEGGENPDLHCSNGTYVKSWKEAIEAFGLRLLQYGGLGYEYYTNNAENDE